MKKSPACGNYETTSDHEGFPEFYPPVDFIQFLEEARLHVRHEINTQPSSSPRPEDQEPTQKRILVQQVGVEDDDGDHDERKSKKWTWKTSLIKWWKGYKKKTKKTKKKKKSNNNNNEARFAEPEPEPPFAVSSGAHRHRHVSRSNYSGPIYGSGRKVAYNSSRWPSSGPLACLFSPTKRAAEHEIPYTRLDQLTNDPPGDRIADGPLYKVT